MLSERVLPGPGASVVDLSATAGRKEAAGGKHSGEAAGRPESNEINLSKKCDVANTAPGGCF